MAGLQDNIWRIYCPWHWFLKKTKKKQLVRTDCSDQFICSLLIRAHVSLLLLVNGRRSWQPDSRETRHKSPLPKHTATHIHPLSALLCDQHTSMYALWSEVEKMALNQRTTNHRQAFQFQQSLVSTCKHTYAYTQLRRSFLVYVLINACS